MEWIGFRHIVHPYFKTERLSNTENGLRFATQAEIDADTDATFMGALTVGTDVTLGGDIMILDNPQYAGYKIDWLKDNPDKWERVEYTPNKTNESMDFKRGDDPYNKLTIGKFREFKEGDLIKMFTSEQDWEEGEILKYVPEDHFNWALFTYIDTISFDTNQNRVGFGVIINYPLNNDTSAPARSTHMNWLQENPDKWERLENTNESIGFKRGGVPYDKLGIGPKVRIDNWFKEWAPGVDYEIFNDLNIIVNENLYLGNSEITELPDNLIVNGSLDLWSSKITKLPDNLTISRSIDLEGSKITKLPDNLIVGRSLFLRYTNITKLPDNLIVTGFLDIRNTNITKLPYDLKVGKKIYKDF